MLAMPGLRAFSLVAKRGSEGVSCDAHGVFVGGVPLLQAPDTASPLWRVRPLSDLNRELAARYRLPIDVAAKGGALALVAAALNRGDLAMAAIATVQMQFPDPPPLAKGVENQEEITFRARDLIRSGLLKFWDPAEHPRAGVPPNPGWFSPVGDEPEKPLDVIQAGDKPEKPPHDVILVGDPSEKPPLDPIPDNAIGYPEHKPWEGEQSEPEGGGPGGIPRGILELPLPGGSLGAPGRGATPARPPAPVATPPRSWSPPDPKSKLPFMAETEPKLAPYCSRRKNVWNFLGSECSANRAAKWVLWTDLEQARQ